MSILVKCMSLDTHETPDGRVLVPSPYVKACDFFGLVGIFFFLKLSTTIFPLHGPSNQVDR